MVDVVVVGLVMVAIVGVYLFFKAVELLTRFFAVVVVSAIFPVAMVKFFGVGWTLSQDLIVSFVILGVLGFVIYYVLALLEMLLKPVTKSIGFLGRGKKKRDKEHEKHKDKHDSEED